LLIAKISCHDIGNCSLIVIMTRQEIINTQILEILNDTNLSIKSLLTNIKKNSKDIENIKERLKEIDKKNEK